MTSARSAAEIRLAEIASLASAATEGPWEWVGSVERPRLQRVGHSESGEVLSCSPLLGPTDADAEFITAARTTIEELHAAVTAGLARHQRVQVYRPSNACEHEDGNHKLGMDAWGDPVCLDTPTGEVQCSTCLDDYGDPAPYPCLTVQDLTAPFVLEVSP